MAARKPPVSRARMPQHRKGGGQHAAAVRLARPSPRASQQAARSSNSARRAQAAAKTSAQTARKGVTVARAGVAHGGQHALMAEFLLFCAIVAMRAIADYVPQDQGASKGKITPPSGQLGPLPILAGGMVTFFVLSFVAARGGTWAKVAAAFGLLIDVTLLMKSVAELETVSGAFTNLSAQQQQAATTNNGPPQKTGAGPTPEGN
jgi:hypothetical protein